MCMRTCLCVRVHMYVCVCMGVIKIMVFWDVTHCRLLYRSLQNVVPLHQIRWCNVTGDHNSEASLSPSLICS